MIKVLSPGIFSTIQDFGRLGFQKYGVPYSGVMDRTAAAFSNAILGNPNDFPVLEITMQGPKLQFDCDTQICISGATMSPKLNGGALLNNKPYRIVPGDVLSFGKLTSGFRVYLAISGGFKTEKVMQSYSMYQGITKTFKLSKHDVLEISSKNHITTNNYASIKVNSDYMNSKDMAVFKGPEFDMLTAHQKESLLNREFSISKDNNRMAYQLHEVLENNLSPIITSAVLPGVVQLTPSGKLIILMRDCQTTGGYPRVLQLKETSINKLAQKYSGQSVVFRLDN